MSAFLNVQYCYDLLISQIPISLILYSHVPTAVAAIAFSLFVVWKARNLASTCLFLMCLCFAAWCAFDLSTWFAFLGSADVMFAWSLLDLVAVIMFFFTYYFLYVSITGKDVPNVQKALGVLVVVPTAVWTLLGQHLIAFDANSCEALEHSWITLYPYVAEAIFIVASCVLLIARYRGAESVDKKRQVVLYGIGTLAFLLLFFSATLFVTILTSTDFAVFDPYNYEIYGLFGMPVLLLYLGYLIVRYQAFQMKVLGAQVLVAALVLLIASEFLFVETTVNVILVGITLVLASAFGVVLVRSVGREVDQREKLQVLTEQLQATNTQLVEVSHFKTQLLSIASHQIKAPLAAMKGYIALILEKAYGEIPEGFVKPMAAMKHSADGLVDLITSLLDLRKIEEGKMDYVFSRTDLTSIVRDVVEELRLLSIEKKLALTAEVPAEPVWVKADAPKLKQVVQNLVDNAIKYTPGGSVAVKLTYKGRYATCVVSDTGLGMAPALLPRLFDEFTRDQRVQRTIRGTGLGLYIAKRIIEAHGGSVSAASAGEGLGSQFTIALPLDQTA